MARQKVNKSEEIRKILSGNRKMKAKEVVSTLAGRGIDVTEGLVYFVKGHMKGRRGRRRKARRMAARVAATTGTNDAVATIVKVMGWAEQVGGMKNLKALVDALTN
jgi:hypothetical protein